MTVPIASLAPLRFANGSASYTSPSGDQILGSVNGPAEVNRRDPQKPEEATLEILVKPGVGGSGVGERYVEGILRSVLTRVILMRDKALARRAIVVTLVVMKNKTAEGRVDERGGSYLPILPSLLHTALLSLLSAAIPMSMIYTASLVAVSPSNQLIPNPSPTDVKSAVSLHVLAFSSKGHLLLNESQGEFDIDLWEKAHDCAEALCRGGTNFQLIKDGDVSMADSGKPQSLEQFVRDIVEDKARENFAWKLATT
ncbi:exosome non-catalytic core subunit rrp46 [Emydomyces testavorans]|uniref:Exosome non-catalytic core subunit rrp46 n=1 Tax=Emydomyces testavorans TaxID=2070801 RepID=A0AAF0DH08_9EURO|nr:exosome non-catalytic core subunit rrp46 [Emydomyces testavorans]